ncbi:MULTISPECIES: DUF2069 domain-containing protein, partial [Gammaproteobacteria]
MTTADSPAKKPITVKFQRAALFGYVGLLILIPLWMYFVPPLDGNTSWVSLFFPIIPLLLPLRGIIQDNTYTYA